MDILKEIKIRRSVREFTNKEVEEDKIRLLLEAFMLGPSAKNERPWELIVVSNPILKDQLSEVSQYAKACLKANVIIVPILDTTKVTTSTSYAEQDMALASQNLLLEAVHLGLGAVYLGVYPNQERVRKAKEFLNIKDDTKFPFCFICIGYPSLENANSELNERIDFSRVKFIK